MLPPPEGGGSSTNNSVNLAESHLDMCNPCILWGMGDSPCCSINLTGSHLGIGYVHQVVGSFLGAEAAHHAALHISVGPVQTMWHVHHAADSTDTGGSRMWLKKQRVFLGGWVLHMSSISVRQMHLSLLTSFFTPHLRSLWHNKDILKYSMHFSSLPDITRE